MTLRFRLTNTALWVWMFGVTVTLVGLVYELVAGTDGVTVIALGTLLMFAGLAMPVALNIYETAQGLRREVFGAGGDEA